MGQTTESIAGLRQPKFGPCCRLLLPVFCLAIGIVSGKALFAEQAAGKLSTPLAPGYVGPEVCATCHRAIAKSQQATDMAKTSTTGADCPVLRAHPNLVFHLGRYTYRIRRKHGQSIYSVSDGRQTLSAPIRFAFGDDFHGQTYLFLWKGAYYQSEVSFYRQIQGLAVTAGLPHTPPASLEAALGTPPPPPGGAAHCFGCHNTGAVVNGRLETKRMIPGVTCEACHGSGARHVAAMKAGKFTTPHIVNPARLSPAKLNDFCGSCHRTWLATVMNGRHGYRTLHFQPYRLENSRCWIATNRINCLTCHDPHKELAKNASSYDPACLSCHRTTPGPAAPALPGHACAAGRKKDCVSCHMPKIELPGAPFELTDHQIRIVRADAPLPP